MEDGQTSPTGMYITRVENAPSSIQCLGNMFKAKRFHCSCYRLTDTTGEIHNLITEEQFPAGVYRVEFDTKSYWKNEGSTPFHDVADVSIYKNNRHTFTSTDRPSFLFCKRETTADHLLCLDWFPVSLRFT